MCSEHLSCALGPTAALWGADELGDRGASHHGGQVGGLRAITAARFPRSGRSAEQRFCARWERTRWERAPRRLSYIQHLGTILVV